MAEHGLEAYLVTVCNSPEIPIDTSPSVTCRYRPDNDIVLTSVAPLCYRYRYRETRNTRGQRAKRAN
jgi:hypothetical protein